IVHTLLNWGCIMAYLKNKAKKFKMFTVDFNISLVITLVITVMTLFSLPPINAIQEFNHRLKETAAEKYGEPPYGHAEASTLKSFCKRTGLDLKGSIKKMEKADLKTISAEATLAEIAGANGMTPQQVYDIIKPASNTQKGMPKKAGMGLGRRALSGICDEYGLDVDATIKGLKGLGIEASAKASMKTIAEKNDMAPSSVFEAIRQLESSAILQSGDSDL
ncbi:MAG: hypothetical protein U9P12_02465, partial [Verrucomicrobiota bacterium]|nr:hypothetical protein [Verrucomicrobiota bacterium]